MKLDFLLMIMIGMEKNIINKVKNNISNFESFFSKKNEYNKYISKSKGHYTYDNNIISHKWGEDDIINPSKIFLNPVTQKTMNDITKFFIKKFAL